MTMESPAESPTGSPAERWERSVVDAGASTSARTTSGLEVGALHAPDDPDADYRERSGWPGQPPYTRGATPEGYLVAPWVMGMYSGYGSPEATNRRIRDLLARGQGGFSIALDLPTQNGYDSDHPMAAGEVGRVGVPLDSLIDVEQLLEGIQLDQVRQIRTTANAIGPIVVALIAVAAERHGFRPNDFRVMLQNDVLKEYLARGTQIFPAEFGLRFSVDVIEYCAEHLPNWEPIELCGYHIREAGADAVQEVAIAMANGFEYIEEALRRGLSIDDFAPSLFMFLSAGLDLFEEVAKFRAARRVWDRMVRERYAARLEESRRLKIFCYTLGSAQTAQQPLNNVSRVAFQSLAAVLGGVQTLATSSYDEALGLPSEEAVQVALRTQQILSEETGVRRTIDPLGGSYLVEDLTDRFERSLIEYLGRIEEQGGALQALRSGWLHAEVEERSYERFLAVERGDVPVVGVNTYVTGGAEAVSRVTRVDDSFEHRKAEELAQLRTRRDDGAVERALVALEQGIVDGRNSIPFLMDAVRVHATIGEICERISRVVGRHVSGTG